MQLRTASSQVFSLCLSVSVCMSVALSQWLYPKTALYIFFSFNTSQELGI